MGHRRIHLLLFKIIIYKSYSHSAYINYVAKIAMLNEEKTDYGIAVNEDIIVGFSV
jgi:hypothetical protein